MRRLTDGEREIVREQERDAEPTPAEWAAEQAWEDEEEARRLDWEIAMYAPAPSSAMDPDDDIPS